MFLIVPSDYQLALSASEPYAKLLYVFVYILVLLIALISIEFWDFGAHIIQDYGLDKAEICGMGSDVSVIQYQKLF